MRYFKTLLILTFVLPFISASAQKADSVEMGAGYGNDVYYSLRDGEIKKSPNNNWDLGFRTGFRSDGIFINSISSSFAPRSTKLYLYPKGDKTAWSTFDTSGMANWLEYQNSDSSWEFGAFNRAAGVFPDFSWGVYNPVTKIVEGDSLYLLEVTNGANTVYKKLLIQDKNFGIWHFKYADIDGSNEVNDSIVASNANAKVLDYYSVITGAQVSREPDSVKYWDIVFKRYHELLAPTFDTYYPVMGIWAASKDVKVAQVDNKSVTTFDHKTLVEADYKTEANIIGSDWKFFDMSVFQWKLKDSLAYYIKGQNGAIWRVYFTAFGGQANGKTIFNKTQMSPGTSINPIAPVASFGVYPNPASSNIEVVFENRDNSVKNTLRIYNIAGQVVAQQNLDATPGLHAKAIDVSSLANGVYIVSIENAGHIITQKLIKE
jgi:hypothetical protein